MVAAPLATKLRDSFAAEFDLLDYRLRASLDSDVALVRSISEYIVTGGGKRMRLRVARHTSKEL